MKDLPSSELAAGAAELMRSAAVLIRGRAGVAMTEIMDRL